MVEWESQQVSPLCVRPQQTMSSGDSNKAFGLGTSVAEQWLTSDISNLQQEADSLCNSVLHSDQDQISFSLDESPKLKSEEEKIPVQSSILNMQNPSLLNLIISNNLWESWEMNTDVTGSGGKNQDFLMDNRNPLPMWGFPMDVDTLKIDDVFQVDKADLFQGPTLAELNANDESLFDSLDIFDLCVPNENKYATPYKTPKTHTVTLSSKTLPDYPECSMKISCGNLKLTKEIPVIKTEPGLPIVEDKIPFSGEALAAANVPEDTRKTPAAPEVFCGVSQSKELSGTFESKLQTVPTHSPSSPVINTSKPVEAAAAVIKKETDDKSLLSDLQAQEKIVERHLSESDNPSNFSTFSNDEGFDSQGENSDNDYVFSSDAESGDDNIDDMSPTWTHSVDKWAGNKKKTRYFWQYNIQAKGPKGPKLKLATHFANPHSLTNVTDPVFSTACRIEGIKHSGKARRGDGNDLTPNPRKLYSIGVELQKLSSVINDLKPVNELPFYARPKSRKEKNKLASRVCRLKKKAQHEANKLKFFGLQKEHRQLLNLLQEVKRIFKSKLRSMRSSQEESCHKKMENLFAKDTCTRVAGCSAEFVNGVLDKVASGDPCGGLNKM